MRKNHYGKVLFSSQEWHFPLCWIRGILAKRRRACVSLRRGISGGWTCDALALEIEDGTLRQQSPIVVHSINHYWNESWWGESAHRSLLYQDPLYSDGSLLLGIDFLGAISRVHFQLQDQYILPLSRALYFLRLFQNYLYLCYIEP